MSKLLIYWGYAWSIIALPFIYVVLLCALIGAGPRAAREWAQDIGVPGFR